MQKYIERKCSTTDKHCRSRYYDKINNAENLYGSMQYIVFNKIIFLFNGSVGVAPIPISKCNGRHIF